MSHKLPHSFFTRPNPVQIAQELLGKVLVSEIDGRTSGIIVETEAYDGRNDRACHAHAATRTARTDTMYQEGGIAYVYLCYGIHHLINVVTNEAELADAVLIRGVEPLEGIDLMLARRKMEKLQGRVTAGPGCLTQAMAINRSHDRFDLRGDQIWIEDQGIRYAADEIETGVRVGVAYAKEDALLPWRFWVKGNPYVSKARPKYPQFTPPNPACQ